MSHTNEIEALRMFHRRVSAVQLDECRIGTRPDGLHKDPHGADRTAARCGSKRVGRATMR